MLGGVIYQFIMHKGFLFIFFLLLARLAVAQSREGYLLVATYELRRKALNQQYKDNAIIIRLVSPDEQVTTNNYFQYDEEAVEKLEFIQDAKLVGFTIQEIGQIIDAWYHKKYSKKEKLSILKEKLTVLEQKLLEIRQMKKQIARFKEDIEQGRC